MWGAGLNFYGGENPCNGDDDKKVYSKQSAKKS